MEHLPELRGLNLDRSDLALLFDVVERLDGFPRHIALHPSGVLLADRTLRDIVPLERSAAGFAMAQFDKDDVEALGLCKLDVLAVRMLSSMAHAKSEMQRTRGVELDFEQVPFNDEDTYELIRSTRTLGMFQIESPGQRELVGKFQPEHLSDLVVDISLFRPGPVKGDMVRPFLERRHRAQVAGGGSAQKGVYPHPILERALGETYGVIVYHEQVMRCVAAVTGCDMATADLVRRRLGDPDELESLHKWIVAGARERGVGESVAESLWHALAQFASFGFCKAHAAAFAVPTYRSAWLKAHYLPEFVAGLLTHDPGMYPRRLLLDDARQFGVAVLPLDVNKSARDYRVERLPADEATALLDLVDGRPSSGFDKGFDPVDPAWRFGIRLALQDVAGIDEKMIDSLLAARPFTSVGDVRRRAALSAPVAEALAHAGAFDEVAGVGVPRRSSSEAVATSGSRSSSEAVATSGRSRREVLLEVTERWSGVRRHQPTDPYAPQQLGLLAAEDPAGLTEYRDSEKVRAELEVLGIDASHHVMHFYKDLLALVDVTPARSLVGCRGGQRVRVAGVKVATQTPPVKSGQRIIFLSLDDSTGVTDSTFFESVHDRCAWTVFHTWLLVVEGTVHRTGRRGVSLNAEVVWDLRRLMRAWREGWLDEALAENRVAAASRPADEAGRNFGDQAPAGIAGAQGRSGLFPERGGSLGRAPADVGARSRVTPNGTTWADPTGRNGNVEDQDLYRLPITDPRHPRHIPAEDSDEDAPRKLWHSSGGSAGG
jgi:error-prone DNA polymerase